jgi:hypothetical protein
VAFSLVQSASAGNSGDGSINITLPSPPTAGNVLILVYGIRLANVPAAPTGFTLLTGNDFAGPDAQGHAVYAKVSDGSEQTVSFGFTIASSLLMEWSGFAGRLPLVDTSAVADITDSATATFPALTTTENIGLLLLASQWKKLAVPNPGPQTLAGHTVGPDSGYAGIGNRMRLTCWYQKSTGAVASWPAVSLSSSGDATDDANLIRLALSVDTSVGSAPRGLSGAPEYVIELYDSGATFGPNVKLAELWDSRNVGWSRYDRLAGKAFFTLDQTSKTLPFIVDLTTHVAIWRITPNGDTLVYRGAVINRNTTGDDVVVDCFDYLSLLSISRSGFKTLYPTKKLGTEIVSPEWALAKGAGSSPLGFVTTGTIEDPLGTDGVTPIKTNAQFGTLDQSRLQLFYDLSEMGRANTTNHVTFEIDLNNTFNVWKNRGAAAEVAFILNGNISDYQYLPGSIRYRNDLATIAAGGSGGAAEIVATNSAGITAKGRRQDVTTLKTLAGISGGGTEADQQKAALERELKKLLQQTSGLALKVARGKVEPFVGFSLNDTAVIEIENGNDLITGTRRIIGLRCLFAEAGEDIAVVINEVTT